MSDTIYALYAVFMGSDDLREELADPDDRRDAAQELENLYKSWEGTVTVRGTYSTVGFRPDADLMIWLFGPTPQDVQRALVEFRRTTVGRHTDLTWTFMGVVKPAEFTADHAPAFVKGTPAETFLCVYPFVRTPEWYLLPREERSELLREHGVAGREFPEVLRTPRATSGSATGSGSWRSRPRRPSRSSTSYGASARRRPACTRRSRSRSSRGSASPSRRRSRTWYEGYWAASARSVAA
jgi:chlorite dismutase